MEKAQKDLKRVVAKARWLTPQGMELKKLYSRWAKSVWSTNRALRIRRQMSRELRMLYDSTDHLERKMKFMLRSIR